MILCDIRLCSLPLRQNVLFMTARLLMYFSGKLYLLNKNKQTNKNPTIFLRRAASKSASRHLLPAVI